MSTSTASTSTASTSTASTSTVSTSTASTSTVTSRRCVDCRDGLGAPTAAPPGSRRERIRSQPGLAQAWRIVVFVAGLLCVALGAALAVLPGPLTIPPVLAGLWIWSTEFAWAERLLASFSRKARAAWEHARRHPVSSVLITVGGLAAAAVAVWAVQHFDLVTRARDAVGL